MVYLGLNKLILTYRRKLASIAKRIPSNLGTDKDTLEYKKH